MKNVKCYAAQSAQSPLGPFSISRREVGEEDISIEIQYCGVCHSDLHQVKDEWGGAIFPMVPGHEIIGKVVETGSRVNKYKKGDLVGVGCYVDSCRKCDNCSDHEEQYCSQVSFTYNSTEKDRKTPTYGGYSSHIVVDQNYALRIPQGLDPAAAAPLLCAGITTYSPLKHWKVGKNDQVGVMGLGGLGHMAIKFAASLGAEVTVFSHSPNKKADAMRLGAQHFVSGKEEGALEKQAGRFDFVIDAVSAWHDINPYLNLLKRDGALTLLGVPPKPFQLNAFPLIMGRRRLAGSLIGGLKDTQEMLDYCGDRKITSDVEVVRMSDINAAYERMLRGDVKYRFVIDLKTL